MTLTYMIWLLESNKLRWKVHLVGSVAILSVLVRNDNDFNKLVQGVNISLKHLCKVYGFDFICNDRIGNVYGEMASISQRKVHHL